MGPLRPFGLGEQSKGRGDGPDHLSAAGRRRRVVGLPPFRDGCQRLSRLRKRTEEERRTGATGTLVKDPETGEYRVRREEEE